MNSVFNWSAKVIPELNLSLQTNLVYLITCVKSFELNFKKSNALF